MKNEANRKLLGRNPAENTQQFPVNSGGPPKINLLFIIDGLGGHGGGTENHLASVISHLNKNLFNIFVCTFYLGDGPMVQRIKDGGATFVHFPVGRFLSWNTWRQAQKLGSFIRANNIQIVQTFHFKSDTYGVWVARRSKVPVIISSRRDMGDLKQRRHLLINRLANRWIDRFIMVCDSVKEATAAVESIPLSKAITIHNGVDIEKFQRVPEEQLRSLRESLDIQSDDFVVGSVAHFRPEKAYHIFFAGIEKVKDKIKNLKVVAVGYPKDQGQNFLSYCKEKKMDHFVRFVGGVRDVRPYVQMMSVLCLIPNRNEGFSNSILEGMSMGKPIVATDVGGNREAVVHGETGFIIPPNDPDAFATALLELSSKPSLQGKMGERGRKRIEEVFNLKDMIHCMEDLYKRCYDEAFSQVGEKVLPGVQVGGPQ